MRSACSASRSRAPRGLPDPASGADVLRTVCRLINSPKTLSGASGPAIRTVVLTGSGSTEQPLYKAGIPYFERALQACNEVGYSHSTSNGPLTRWLGPDCPEPPCKLLLDSLVENQENVRDAVQKLFTIKDGHQTTLSELSSAHQGDSVIKQGELGGEIRALESEIEETARVLTAEAFLGVYSQAFSRVISIEDEVLEKEKKELERLTFNCNDTSVNSFITRFGHALRSQVRERSDAAREKFVELRKAVRDGDGTRKKELELQTALAAEYGKLRSAADSARNGFEEELRFLWGQKVSFPKTAKELRSLVHESPIFPKIDVKWATASRYDDPKSVSLRYRALLTRESAGTQPYNEMQVFLEAHQMSDEYTVFDKYQDPVLVWSHVKEVMSPIDACVQSYQKIGSQLRSRPLPSNDGKQRRQESLLVSGCFYKGAATFPDAVKTSWSRLESLVEEKEKKELEDIQKMQDSARSDQVKNAIRSWVDVCKRAHKAKMDTLKSAVNDLVETFSTNEPVSHKATSGMTHGKPLHSQSRAQNALKDSRKQARTRFDALGTGAEVPDTIFDWKAVMKQHDASCAESGGSTKKPEVAESADAKEDRALEQSPDPTDFESQPIQTKLHDREEPSNDNGFVTVTRRKDKPVTSELQSSLRRSGSRGTGVRGRRGGPGPIMRFGASASGASASALKLPSEPKNRLTSYSIHDLSSVRNAPPVEQKVTATGLSRDPSTADVSVIVDNVSTASTAAAPLEPLSEVYATKRTAESPSISGEVSTGESTGTGTPAITSATSMRSTNLSAAASMTGRFNPQAEAFIPRTKFTD